jgi:long-chain-fatty-acid--CoA ligase ACSBG
MTETNKWVTLPNEFREINLTSDYPNNIEVKTVVQQFQETVNFYGNKTAFKYEENEEWVNITWNKYNDLVNQSTKSLIKFGISANQGVAIHGFNSYQWIVANLAAIFSKGLSVGIYPTNGPEVCKYIIDHSKTKVLFVDTIANLNKYIEDDKILEGINHVIVWNDQVSKENYNFSIYSWQEFLEFGQDVSDDDLNSRKIEQNGHDVCSLIYTSGTTGFPKAVMLSHDNLIWTSKVLKDEINLNEEDRIVSYLPLSHVAAQAVDIYAPMISGCELAFARQDALKGSLTVTLQAIRPTIFFGVPRVWEKIEEKMKAVGRSTTGLKKIIVDYAKSVGLYGGYALQRGEDNSFLYNLFNYLLFSKIKEKLGLDQARILITAAAPISKETLEYFMSIGMNICECFGMSECSGPQTISLPKKSGYKTGSCGKTIIGTVIKIDNPDEDGNGEIIFRGRNTFMGYMNNKEATKETIDENGFLHSGDIGRLDDDGYLFITGRKKEIIITAGGENVPPVLIEQTIKKYSELISNVVVIGDNRKFLSCLITLKHKMNPDGSISDKLTDDLEEILREKNISTEDIEQVYQNELLLKIIQESIDKANLDAISKAQKVQKFKVIPKDFTLETEELTPSLKLRRKIVNQKYEKIIEDFYK